MKTANAVVDGKLTNEGLGKLWRLLSEIIKRINEGVLDFARVCAGLQMVIEDKVPYIVDLDAAPFCPEELRVMEHHKGGQFVFDSTKVHLHLEECQKNGKFEWGVELRKALLGKGCLNANFLDFYLANPHHIPEEWKGKAIFFWGTIYELTDSSLCVRSLYFCWDDDEWCSNYSRLRSNWDERHPSIVVV